MSEQNPVQPVQPTEPVQAAPPVNKTGKGPVNMEGAVTGGTPDVEGGGRKVDPDKDAPPEVVKEKPLDEHMEKILKYIPDDLKERVSKLTRAELSMPGVPADGPAYNAYLSAEKIIRDKKRRKTKENLDFSNVPRQSG